MQDHKTGLKNRIWLQRYSPTAVLLIVIAVFFHSHSAAQGTIKTEEVDIVKAYQPLLSDADKIDFEAQPAIADTTMQLLQYDVKSHLIEVPFTPAEIKAVSLPVEEAEIFQNNLVKAGFGTQLTPLLDVYLHNGETDKFSYGLNFHHLSSNGSKIAFQDFSHTGGLVFGKAYVGSTSLAASIGYDHRKNYNYADVFTDTNDVTKKSLKRIYNLLPLSLTFQNTKISKGNFNYRFNFIYHHFDDVPNNMFLLSEKEDYFNFNMTLQKLIKKIHSGNIEFTYQNLHNKAVGVFDTTQMIYSIVPYYGLNMDKFNLILGVNVSVLNKTLQIFPRIRGEYKLIGEYLIPYVGFKGEYEPVTMDMLTNINPYVGNISTSVSRVIDAYIGMKGSYGNNISYNIKAGYESHSNLPVFLPDSINPAYYDADFYYDANIIHLHAEVGYRESERFNLVLSGETNSYSLDFDDQPWGIPKSRIDFTFSYNLQEKIFANVDIFATSGAFTILPGDSVSTQLKGRVDANLSVTYNYKKNIALWIAINNITGSKSSPWYNYPTYGFQAMAGVNLKF